jgi:hypothetical protein
MCSGVTADLDLLRHWNPLKTDDADERNHESSPETVYPVREYWALTTAWAASAQAKHRLLQATPQQWNGDARKKPTSFLKHSHPGKINDMVVTRLSEDLCFALVRAFRGSADVEVGLVGSPRCH